MLEVANGACCVGTVCCKFVFRRVVGGVMYCSVHSLPLTEEHRNEEEAIIKPIAISNGFFPRTMYKISLQATHKLPHRMKLPLITIRKVSRSVFLAQPLGKYHYFPGHSFPRNL